MSTSYSKTDTYAKCPKLYEYKYIRNLQAKRKNSNLFRGITAHDILRDWYLLQREHGGITVTPDEFVARWITNYWTDATNLPIFEDELFDHRKEVEQVATYVRRFLELGKFDDWTILHVEEEFTIEIDGHKVTFTPDLVAMDPDGNVWIIDHKTSGKHIDRDALDIRPQALFYYIGVSQFYENVAGFIFNYIRKKVPTTPRLNKTGKKAVTDLNRIDTDYETLRAFIVANDLLDEPAHRRRLGELRDRDTFFFQHPFYITPDMVEQAAKDIAARLRLISMHYLDRDTIGYPRTVQPFDGCKRCEFNSICVTELTGGNTDMVLQWYEPREEKNPYEREDEEAE